MLVREHAGSQRQFALGSLASLQPGGLLYLEVPAELDPHLPLQCRSRLVDHIVNLHEHIGQFHGDSISRLVESIATLRLLKAEHADIDCGWTTDIVGRYLARHVG